MDTHETRTRHNTSAAFAETQWSQVLVAVTHQSPGAEQALESLCSTYWPPIYGFLRRHGQNPEDARDLTQGFFSHLLRGARLQGVDPACGKFRSFLLACLRNYVCNELDKQNADKRGSGQVPLPIAAGDTAGETIGVEPATTEDPAKAYEREWARTLVSEVLNHLRQQCRGTGREELFERLLPFLTDEAERGDYAAVAARLGLSEGSLRTSASRLRSEYRSLLLAEVRRTVGNPDEVEEEIRHLLRVFGS